MDFSPMHPDVWAKTDARRWQFYLQHRIAYEDGRDEVKRRRGNKAKTKSGMQDLIKRVTG
jgi:hypothetical protein